MLTSNQFNREIDCERIRATCRPFPFCVITIEIQGSTHRRRRDRLLQRNLRMTNQKARLMTGSYGVLLVNTSEVGGRVVMNRLTELADMHSLRVIVDLRVHDSDGSDSAT